MYIDVDTAIAVPVNFVPLIDDTDFKTREVAITFDQAGMDLVWNFVTTAGVQTQTAVTPTTAGVHDWTHVGDAMYKLEIPASAGTINNDTEGTGWFTGFATGVLPWTGPKMTFRAAGINNKMIDDAYDAVRGLSGTALPASGVLVAAGPTNTQLEARTLVTASYFDPATDTVANVTTVGTTTTNTDMRGTDSAALATVCTETRLAELDAANLPADIDAILEDTGTTLPLTLSTINSNVILILADTGTTIPALIATAQADLDIITDTDGVIIGAAGIDLVWDEVLTGATHNVTNSSGKRLREISATIFNSGTAQTGASNTITLETGASTINDFYDRAKVIIVGGTGLGQEAIITEYVGSTLVATVTPSWTTNPDNTSEYEVVPGQVHSTVRNGGYDNGFVYFKTGGDSGTQKGVNGTSTRPSGSEADTYAIMAQENLTKVFIEPGSTFNLPSDSSNKQFDGSRYILTLNGQNVDNSEFDNAASVTGTATADSNNPPAFFACGIGDVTLPPCNGFQCGFFGTFTIGSAGNFTFGGSADIFNLKLTIDYGALLNASQFFIQSWGGGEIEIQNAGAGTGSYLLDIHGMGAVTVNANCSATTTVEAQGHIRVVNNGTGITINDTTNVCAAIDYGSGQSIGANLNDMAGATFATATDSLEAIRNNAVQTDIADTILARSVSFVEDTADVDSLAKVVLMAGHSDTTTNAGFITVFKTDGTTEFEQITIVTSASAELITVVS